MHHNDSDHTQLSKAISIFMNNNVVKVQVLEVMILWDSTVRFSDITSSSDVYSCEIAE